MMLKNPFPQTALAIGFVLLSFYLVTRTALAGEACPPVQQGDYCCDDPDNLAPVCLEKTFANVLKGVLSLVGLGSFAFIIRGGIKYTMAGGDMKALDEAKKTLTWSVIGLGFSVLSFFTLQLISQTFGANILRFVIPEP